MGSAAKAAAKEAAAAAKDLAKAERDAAKAAAKEAMEAAKEAAKEAKEAVKDQKKTNKYKVNKSDFCVKGGATWANNGDVSDWTLANGAAVQSYDGVISITKPEDQSSNAAGYVLVEEKKKNQPRRISSYF